MINNDKNNRKERVKTAIDKVVETFKTQDIPAIAYAVFKSQHGKPSDKWSFLNRLLMYLSGTTDGRGFNQWKKANRHVKKGAKAFYILVPFHIAADNGEHIIDESGEVKKKDIILFKPTPVFRHEDTTGEAVKQDNFKLEIPCDLKKVADGFKHKHRHSGVRGSYLWVL